MCGCANIRIPRKLDQLAPFAGARFAGHALAVECRIRQEAV